MEITHIENRQTDNMHLLNEFMCDDAISIVNDYLDNQVISLSTTIKYGGFTFQYTRKPRSEFIKLYNQSSQRTKQCVQDLKWKSAPD